MVPKEYKRAEARLQESIKLRRDGYPHTYPRREEDLETMRSHHAEYGVPPAGPWARLKWWVGGGA